MASPLETVEWQGQPLACILRAGYAPTKTEFLTPNNFMLQMGLIVYGQGQSIQAHRHLPVTREVHGTSEVVMVREGECEVDIYSFEKEFVATCRLAKGDIIMLPSGGHGFRMTADTVLFEVKQGPFLDGQDKERF